MLKLTETTANVTMTDMALRLHGVKHRKQKSEGEYPNILIDSLKHPNPLKVLYIHLVGTKTDMCTI